MTRLVGYQWPLAVVLCWQAGHRTPPYSSWGIHLGQCVVHRASTSYTRLKRWGWVVDEEGGVWGSEVNRWQPPRARLRRASAPPFASSWGGQLLLGPMPAFVVHDSSYFKPLQFMDGGASDISEHLNPWTTKYGNNQEIMAPPSDGGGGREP